jgi:hypothetical protein
MGRPSLTLGTTHTVWKTCPAARSVRYGSISALGGCPPNVRVAYDSGHKADVLRLPKSAKSGLMQCSKFPSLDHLVGADEERG